MGFRFLSRPTAARRPGDVGSCSRGADPNIGWACYCMGGFLLWLSCQVVNRPGCSPAAVSSASVSDATQPYALDPGEASR